MRGFKSPSTPLTTGNKPALPTARDVPSHYVYAAKIEAFQLEETGDRDDPGEVEFSVNGAHTRVYFSAEDGERVSTVHEKTTYDFPGGVFRDDGGLPLDIRFRDLEEPDNSIWRGGPDNLGSTQGAGISVAPEKFTEQDGLSRRVNFPVADGPVDPKDADELFAQVDQGKGSYITVLLTRRHLTSRDVSTNMIRAADGDMAELVKIHGRHQHNVAGAEDAMRLLEAETGDALDRDRLSRQVLEAKEWIQALVTDTPEYVQLARRFDASCDKLGLLLVGGEPALRNHAQYKVNP